METFKKTFRRVMAVVIAVIMLVGSAPLEGFLNTDWADFVPVVSAVNEGEVVSITAEPVILYEQIDGYVTTGSYTDENDNEVPYEYFFYEISYSDVYFNVELANGETFRGTAEEVQDRFGCEVYIYIHQPHDTPWSLGDNEFEIEVMGKEITGIARVVEIPIDRIEIDDMSFMEYTNGDFVTEYWDEELQEWVPTNYFCYYINIPSFTVYFNDGREPEVYESLWEFTESTGIGASVEDGQSHETPWGVGNHAVTVTAGSYSTQFNVEITEHIVKSITVAPIELVENYSGYWADYSECDPDTGETTFEDRYFVYELNSDNIYITIEFNDGTSFSGNYNEVGEHLGEYPEITTYQEYRERWTLGENEYEVSVMGKKSTAIADVVENPIERIEVAADVLQDGIDSREETEWIYDEETDTEYQVSWTMYCIGVSYITVYYKDGRVEELSYEDISMEVTLGSDQGYHNQWTPGNTYKANLTYKGFTAEYDVIILENPIEKIEISPDTLVEGKNDFEFEEWIWDDETEEEYKVTWMKYGLGRPDSVTVYYKDGRVEELSEDEIDMECSFSSDQSYDNPWIAGNTYTARLTYKGFTAEYDVIILENPVERIEVADRTSILNYNGEITGEWYEDEDGNEEYREYFKYNVNPLSFTVYFKDGTSETYDDIWEFEEETGLNCQVTSDQSYDNQWGLGTHTATLTVGKVSADYNIIIEEHYIERIAIPTVQITEGTNCYESSGYWDEELQEWVDAPWTAYDLYHVYPITIYYRDGRVETPDAEDLAEYTIYTYQSYDNQWTAGNTYTATIDYQGFRADFEVEILESTIERIEVEDITLRENLDGDMWEDEYYDEENDEYVYEEYFHYDSSPKSLTVYFKDGTVKEYDYPYEFCEDTGFDYRIKDDQSARNPWGAGEYTAEFIAGGVTAEYTVTITGNPIESIVMEPVSIVEYTNGYLADSGYWDENGEWISKKYFNYSIPQTEVTIYFKDGTSAVYKNIYRLVDELGLECEYIDGQSAENPWGVGTHEVKYNIGSYECILEVEITKSPVVEIEIPTVHLCEGKNGYWEIGSYPNENTGEEIEYRYYYYHVDSIDFDIKVTLDDGTVINTTLYEFSELFDVWPEIETDQSYKNPWVSGDEYKGTFIAFGIEIEFDVVFCSHENSTYYPEIAPSCTYDGYEEGWYCSDCTTWYEGRGYKGSVPHIDANEDDTCDVCGKSVSFEKNKGILGKFHFFTDNLFDETEKAPDETVFFYLWWSGFFEEYCDQKAELYTVPYVDYMAIVDKYFANHSDMKEYFRRNDMFTDESEETVRWGEGGFGDASALELLSIYDHGDGKLTLQGVTVDYGYDPEYFTDKTHYYTSESAHYNQFGEWKTYTSYGEFGRAYELTIQQTEDGVQILSLLSSDCYLLDGSIYEIIDDDDQRVRYNRFDINCGEGATIISEGEKLYYQLRFFDNYDYRWYTQGSGFDFDIELEEGYELISVIFEDDNGERELEELSFGGYNVIPDGHATLTVVTENGDGEIESGDYVYTVENGEATITRYKGIGGDLVIPSTLGGYPVVALGYDAFRDTFGLTSVVIPDGVRTIGEGAFRFCFHLESVEIPASVTEIGDAAFFDCNSLTGIYVDEANANYCNDENGILFNKDKTVLIKYPATLAYTTYTVPETVTTIDGAAFYNCSNLINITLNEGVGAIRDYAFWACDNLAAIELPVSLREINAGAFSVCTSLMDVYYAGTEADWEDVTVEEDENEYLLGATMHFADEEPHEHNYESRVISPATCTTAGTKTYTCSCGDSYTESIPATAHKETTLSAKAATCTATGLTAGKKCTVCGTITARQQTMNALGHKEVTVAGKVATYTSTGLTAGKKCTVCGTVTVKQTTIPKLTLGKVSGLKAKDVKVAKSSEIKLSWSKVDGAEKYEVYQKSGKKWKKLKTTSKTSFTVEKLKADKEYQFRVRAIVDDIKGDYSKTLTVETIPETTSKLTLKAGKKQLTASWSKVSDISGYEVQYSTSKNMKKAKTVSAKKSANKTTIKKLTKGKKYYVRVRTYKTVDGKKIYSGWSTVKNVKVK